MSEAQKFPQWLQQHQNDVWKLGIQRSALAEYVQQKNELREKESSWNHGT